MTIKWDDSLSAGLRDVYAKASHMQDDLYKAANETILPDAVERAPKEDGDMAASAKVWRDRGGDNTVAITFDGPYAAYQHEHVGFNHPKGGEAKFLETALLMEGREAARKAGEYLWERL